MIARLAIGLVGLVLSSGLAGAGITEISLGASEPFADGAAFGGAGPYVRVHGIAKGELDPADPANTVIVDLDKASRNARGMVEYETDVFILKPADMAKSSGVLLYELTNRGRKFFLHWLADAKATSPSAVNDPRTIENAGNAFGLDRGYTLVWSGWDPDAPKSSNGMTIRVPLATDNGKPIVERIRNEFQVATRGPGDGATSQLPYPAATTDKAKARLTTRDREGDVRTEIGPDKWEFLNSKTIRPLPEGAKFEPVKIYEVWYEATEPKVLGIGYAATRDLVSFLRYAPADTKGTANPLWTGNAAGIRHTLALGISQSGRYLRHHLELGMNGDEQGRRVFDGVMAHISGAGKVFANHRFGMPNRTATQHEDRFYPEIWFPFGYAEDSDPVSGKAGRLIGGRAPEPKVFEVNTSTEYWQKGASLIHTDALGLADTALPANVRAYLIAGTQHGGRAGLDDKPGLCVMPRNPHNPAPALRALMVALEEWVVADKAPPDSRVPSIAAKTAVPAVQFAKLPGLVSPPGPAVIGVLSDWIDPPSAVTKRYGTLIPAIDADGNETAGIRLPTIAVPAATYTGWNLYKAATTELCDRDGTYLPFAKTKAERDSKGDPRLSLEERYKGIDDYVLKAKAAADALVRERLLLPKDADAYIAQAKALPF